MASETKQDVATGSSESRDMIDSREPIGMINRREAIRRVTLLLGGIALVGGDSLLTGCRDRSSALAQDSTFSPQDIAFLDEVADTILPETKTPGAKAAKVGPFMALMVTDSYDSRDQQAFREGMRKIDDATMKEHNVSFMQATPQQRLALLERLDREQKADADARSAARAAKAGRPATADTSAAAGDKHLPDERKENATGAEAGGAAAITKEPPAHYFRMMKELALLGYFTSEIGYTKAMRYVESPGRFDSCTPYTKGEPAWAPHA